MPKLVPTDDLLRMEPISPGVNKPENDDPSILEPLAGLPAGGAASWKTLLSRPFDLGYCPNSDGKREIRTFSQSRAPAGGRRRTFWRGRRCGPMKRATLIVALLLAATPVAAQPSKEPAPGASSQAPTTGVICQEEIAGTFCNVVGRPSNGGYGLSNGSGGTVGSSSVPTPTPPCGEFPPANELCN
jgi:hypothetical protein